MCKGKSIETNECGLYPSMKSSRSGFTLVIGDYNQYFSISVNAAKKRNRLDGKDFVNFCPLVVWFYLTQENIVETLNNWLVSLMQQQHKQQQYQQEQI